MLKTQEEIPVEKSAGGGSTGIDAAQKYDAAQIDKLEGLEAVRKRPGMFIGDPDERGLHHLVFEVLDNSIDEVKNKKTTGTLITFLPDPTIFTITTEFKFERLATRLRELAFLNPGLEITLTDERIDPAKIEKFFYKHGIEEFVKQLGENKQVLHPKPIVI